MRRFWHDYSLSLVLAGFSITKGSPEAKDSDEETEAHLDRIEARLVAMEQSLGRIAQDRPGQR